MSTIDDIRSLNGRLKTYDRETLVGIGLVVPAVLLIVLTLFYPFARAIWLSFTDLTTGEFVGAARYEWLLGRSEFPGIVLNTFVWTVGNILLQGIIGVGIALLLNRRFFGRDTIRTVMLIPFVIPTAVTAITWRWLFNGSYGPINEWGQSLGLIESSFTPFSDPALSLAAVTIVNVWRWAPLVALIVFAILQTIPPEEYEAARIEGAGLLSEFYHVTYPHLKSGLTVLGLLGFLIVFNIFDVIWLLTEGGPGFESTTLPVYIYEVAFQQQYIGRGNAVSFVLFLILVAFVWAFFRTNDLEVRRA